MDNNSNKDLAPGGESSKEVLTNGDKLFKMVKYHPSTTSDNSNEEAYRKRCNSQPINMAPHRRPRRPQRSMVTMDGILYDPQSKEFTKKMSGTNEQRTLHASRRLQNDTSRLSPAHSLIELHTKNYQNVSRKDCDSLPGNLDINLTAPFTLDNAQYTSSIEFQLKNRISNASQNRRHKMSTVSIRSNLLENDCSTATEKTKMFRGTLATILSTMYAILILTLGTIIYIADAFIKSPMAEIYTIYLIVAGLVYLIFLLTDVRIYINKAKKYHMEKNAYEYAMDCKLNSEANDFIDISKSVNNSAEFLTPPKQPEHNYCFSEGRHAGSFYLKIGAACFCLGHLIHSALFLNLNIVYLASEECKDCGNIPTLILHSIYPIYSFFQLFFIFKYSNINILRFKELNRFALMHCVSASLCFWLRTIIQETMESLRIYAKKSQNIDYDIYGDSVMSQPKFWNISALSNDNCSTIYGFDSIIEHVFPYLYPFTIEYSILIVGIFYILWSNIGHCSKEDDELSDLPHKDWDSYKSSYETESCKAPTAIDDNGMVSNLTINIDCHSSNKGWFGGLIVLVTSIVSVIISYVSISNKDLMWFGVLLEESTALLLNLVMLIAVLVAYYQIKKLDVNKNAISKLDDLLLFICIPAFFMDASFTLVPAVIYTNYLQFFNVVIVVIQVIIQTPFIIDALRRCSNSRDLLRLKPGRELVTFLIVCNVSAWIFETFSIKNAETDDHRYDFYGKVLWTILRHISTPLCMFYRFHSSVCLADIWKCAYVHGNSH